MASLPPVPAGRWRQAGLVLAQLILFCLVLLPLLLYPLWWQVPTSEDADGALRAAHAGHISLLTRLQVGSMVLFLLPILALIQVARLLLSLLRLAPRPRFVMPTVLVAMLALIYFFGVPKTIRSAAYPAFVANAGVIAADLQKIEQAINSYKESEGRWPSGMQELLVKDPAIPTRPPVACMPDYNFTVHPQKDVFITFVKGMFWWDSHAVLIYCPEDKCNEYGYDLETSRRYFGELLYSDYWHFPGRV